MKYLNLKCRLKFRLDNIQNLNKHEITNNESKIIIFVIDYIIFKYNYLNKHLQ